MRVFVAGATGAIGRRLIPVLVDAGHRVTGMTRSPDNAERVRKAGAVPAIADALDRNAVMRAVDRGAPEVILHELTALPHNLDLRHFDRQFTLTNRLRTDGLDNLIAAAREVGCRRIIAQSFAGWPYARQGGPVKTERDPLDPNPPRAFRRAFEAIRYLEQTVTGLPEITGIALRYGAFYGPGNTLGAGGDLLDQVRKRRVPIVGRGILTMPLWRRSKPSKPGLPVSTTLLTMNPRPWRSGFRHWPGLWERSRRFGCRRGSRALPSAIMASS
jgi:nucleoside-diphosphate-sugar epimerase